MKRVALFILFAVLGGPAQAQTAEGAGRAVGSECGSVVIVKCERRNDAESPEAAAERSQKAERARRTEGRRSSGVQDLGTVVIEGERVRSLSVEESIQRAMAGEVRPPGTHTYSTGEGTQCTCMNVCPPWWTLMPCCSCSTHSASRLSVAPGSTPLR